MTRTSPAAPTPPANSHTAKRRPGPPEDEREHHVWSGVTEPHSTIPNTKQLSVPYQRSVDDPPPSSPPLVESPTDHGISPSETPSASSSRDRQSPEHEYPASHLDSDDGDVDPATSSTELPRRVVVGTPYVIVDCMKMTKKSGESSNKSHQRKQPRRMLATRPLERDDDDSRNIKRFHFGLTQDGLHVSQYIVRALHHMWKTSPEVAAAFRNMTPAASIVAFGSSTCAHGPPKNELPPVDHEHRIFNLALFNQHIVHALGLQFTTEERRESLFSKWLMLRYSYPWFSSLDVAVENFIKGITINGKVWSMTPPGGRYDAECVMPQRFLTATFSGNGWSHVRYAAFSATFPIHAEHWGEDDEGSFSWYVKHVVGGKLGKDHHCRDRLVESYCEWCVQEEHKWGEGIFRERFFNGGHFPNRNGSFKSS